MFYFFYDMQLNAQLKIFTLIMLWHALSHIIILFLILNRTVLIISSIILNWIPVLFFFIIFRIFSK